MSDNPTPLPPSELSPTLTPAPPPARPSALHTIFVGPYGIRAGWRFALWVLLVFVLSFLVRTVRHKLLHVQSSDGQELDAVFTLMSRLRGFLVAVVATLIMGRIERGKWADYGLPLRRILSFDFWFGVFWGFAGLTVVMAALWLTGAYRIEGIALAGAAIWKYAILWALAFYFVALLEEFTLRGYPQYTLASGMGFWPSAVILSLVFLSGHIGNPGENWMGLSDVFIIGMFLCFTLWRTGDLWFAVGMHASWDWGLTYFFSVPNSGTVATGHLLNVHTQGPNWLTGGSAGPEGSAINLVFDLLCFVIFAMIYKKRKWVGLKDKRKTVQAPATSPTTLLDSSALQS